MKKKTKAEKNVVRDMWKRQLWKLPWLLLLPIGLLFPVLAEKYPQFINEKFSLGLYPKISDALGQATAPLPGSVAELVLYILAALLLGFVILFLVHLLQRRARWVRITSFILNLGIFAGVMICLMYWLWGFNYARPTLYEMMALDVKERPVEQLESLCLSLTDEAVALRRQVSEDTAGVFTLSQPPRYYFENITKAYDALGREIPLFARKVYPAKQVYASEALSYAGISGIFIPYTAEANVNMRQPTLLLLSAAAHENAHYLGIAKEDEANFVSYLACLRSTEPSVRYSGVMLALIHCTNQLQDADAARYAAVRNRYSEAMVRDLVAYNQYWDDHEGKIEETMDQINDAYLKHNRQEAGVKSYGMMVDLLLAYEDQ